MKAMVLKQKNSKLVPAEIPVPEPRQNQLQVEISACGICRTDLHVIDGELPNPVLPLIPGHQIVGTVTKIGNAANGFSLGQRVGIPWLGGTCGSCSFCNSGQENLCDKARYTGYQINGGFAEYTVADADFCFPIPEEYPDLQAAPLLCAGLIGYRAFRMTGESKKIGLYGFGAAAHILIQTARHLNREIYAFTRPGDSTAQEFARSLGAVWADGSDSMPPDELDAAIIFAPVGSLVPGALQAIRKGGIVVCGGIHMSDIPSFPYGYLWEERSIKSVANLTRTDGREFLALAPQVPVKTEVTEYPLDSVNEALDDLRHGRFNGAAVINIKH